MHIGRQIQTEYELINNGKAYRQQCSEEEADL